MIQVVGVRFKKAGKAYYFDPCGFELEAGLPVIVETARGLEYGFCADAPMEVEEEVIVQPLRHPHRDRRGREEERGEPREEGPVDEALSGEDRQTRP